MHDLLITGAEVADGTGAPLRHTDVAVADGQVVAMGDLKGEAAARTVDADGLVLAPGFVDIHTHYDAQITWDPIASPSTSLGVTTVVSGNCGFGIAPCRPEHRDLVARNLSQVEGMPIEALRAGIRWEYESFPEYLDMLERVGIVPNMAVLAGHSVTRTYVMGEEASLREARDDEIETMRSLVAEALDAGAIGFASSDSHNHFGDDGLPMPSRLATREEWGHPRRHPRGSGSRSLPDRQRPRHPGTRYGEMGGHDQTPRVLVGAPAHSRHSRPCAKHA